MAMSRTLLSVLKSTVRRTYSTNKPFLLESATLKGIDSNPIKMPILGLGTWKSQPIQVTKAVKFALENGYRHIAFDQDIEIFIHRFNLDCAFIYQNEREVGKGIEASNVKREDIFITSKLWNTFHRPDHVTAAIDQTMHDLGVKYLDLYLIHWPVSWKPGGYSYIFQAIDSSHPKAPQEDNTPLWETWEAMEELVYEGAVKAIGVSNFGIEHLEELLGECRIRPAVNQIEIHPYLQQDLLVQYCKEKGIQTEAYSPLGNPTQKPAEGVVPLLQNKTILEIAKKHNRTVAQVLLRWSIQKGHVVIPKSVTPERILENSRIFDFSLDKKDMSQIASLDRDARVVRPPWHPAFRRNPSH